MRKSAARPKWRGRAFPNCESRRSTSAPFTAVWQWGVVMLEERVTHTSDIAGKSVRWTSLGFGRSICIRRTTCAQTAASCYTSVAWRAARHCRAERRGCRTVRSDTAAVPYCRARMRGIACCRAPVKGTRQAAAQPQGAKRDGPEALMTTRGLYHFRPRKLQTSSNARNSATPATGRRTPPAPASSPLLGVRALRDYTSSRIQILCVIANRYPVALSVSPVASACSFTRPRTRRVASQQDLAQLPQLHLPKTLSG